MKSKMKKTLAGILAAVTLAAVPVSLTACGPSEQQVTIVDQGEQKQVTVEAGDTVSEALDEAGVTLGEKDEVSPAKESEITEDLTVTVNRYAKVTVLDGDKKTTVELVGGTVEDALKEAKVTLADDDGLDCELTDPLEDGMKITVTHTITVKITADGDTKKVKTKAATVADVLKEQKIELGKNDRVSPKKTAKLEDGDKIVIKRVKIKKETVTESIPYQTEEQYSDSMASGTSSVTQNGVEGSQEVVYKITYVDGVEESREQVSATVTQNPVNQIIVYGTKVQQAAPAQTPSSSQASSSSSSSTSGGKTEVSRQKVDDCDGSGHGYYIITYSDGSTAYEEY